MEPVSIERWLWLLGGIALEEAGHGARKFLYGKGAYVVLVVLIGFDESLVFYGCYSRSRTLRFASLSVFHSASKLPSG